MIQRYLMKNVLLSLLGLTTLLLFIFMSNQFVRYLNKVAMGQLPIMVLAKLMLIELPNLLVLLLPLGFYVAILMTYSRMYADSEMIILEASGLGRSFLIKVTLKMAIMLSLLLAWMMFWLTPTISTIRTTLLHSVGIKTLIQTMSPERFHVLPHQSTVFYVNHLNQDKTIANGIFLAKQTEKKGQKGWQILTAERGILTFNQDKSDVLVFENGHEYEGMAHQLDWQHVDFKRFETKLPKPEVHLSDDLRTYKTKLLWPFWQSKEKAAEFYWRLSVPLMLMILSVIAVPLSYVNPRSGKFAKFFPAILIYVVYANFMFIARDWVSSGKVPIWLGMWWLHGLFMAVAVFLFWDKKGARP
jgi:lipopolysaccharide export system permease protein